MAHVAPLHSVRRRNVHYDEGAVHPMHRLRTLPSI